MPKTLLWTEDGDLAFSGDAIQVSGTMSSLPNRIYWLLRQADSGYIAGFNIKRYIGRTQPANKLQELESELSDFLKSNVGIVYPLHIKATSPGPHTLNVQITIDIPGTVSSSTYFSYSRGNWTLSPGAIEPIAEERITSNNLLDR